MVVEVLELAAPATFTTGETARRVGRHLALQLGVPEPWRTEAAALLSPLGKVSLAEDLVDRARMPGKLTAAEVGQFNAHPKVAARLLRRVPRLERVAELVEAQLATPNAGDPVEVQIVQVSVAAAELAHSGLSRTEIVSRLKARMRGLDPRVFAALETAPIGAEGVELSLRVEQLRTGMVFQHDVRAKNGTLLAAAGAMVTPMVVERLMRFHARLGIVEPLKVRSST
jgi:hypothetical protein